MTSVVTISAHCGDAKEVRVTITGAQPEEFTIANGENVERFAYDDRVISVKEVVKVDRRAKEIEDAEFSLCQATLRYEDAASRGFPLGNEALLKADAIVKLTALDALTAPAVNLVPAPEPMGGVHFTAHALVDDPAVPSVADYAAAYPIPAGVVDADPLAAVFDPAGHALMGFAEPVAATPGDAGYETKTYADGTTAFGLGPLPDQSPAEQGVARKEISDFLAAQADALPAESKVFLDSLDPAPMISDGTTDSVEGPTES